VIPPILGRYIYSLTLGHVRIWALIHISGNPV